MKYIKLFEGTNHIFNIGDKVILKDDKNGFFNNFYGVVSDKDDSNRCEIKFLHSVTSKWIKDDTSWVNSNYLVKYTDDDEFNKAIEEIELKKVADKYNL